MERAAGWLLLLAACSFEPGTGGEPPPRDGADPEDPTPWWDTSYAHRRQLIVTTGALVPARGYAGYTVQLALDPAQLAGIDTSCHDLRVATFDNGTWTERTRHVLGCGTPNLELRFALPVDLAAEATWDRAYLYYDRPGAPQPASALGDVVYRWWDDGSINRTGDYQGGRMDPWLGTGHVPTLAWNPAGFYTYNTGNDAQESYRRAVDERDVLVEAEFFHTGCYVENFQSGVCARGVIAGGAGGTETADHYYCTSRAQHPACSNVDESIYDGDIVASDNEQVALRGLRNPPPIVGLQWRKQALAVWGAGPTELRFWDADASWPSLANPPKTALQATGRHLADHPGAGFAGVMLAQDVAQLRNLVIRRYIEPEPMVSTRDEQSR